MTLINGLAVEAIPLRIAEPNILRQNIKSEIADLKRKNSEAR